MWLCSQPSCFLSRWTQIGATICQDCGTKEWCCSSPCLHKDGSSSMEQITGRDRASLPQTGWTAEYSIFIPRLSKALKPCRHFNPTQLTERSSQHNKNVALPNRQLFTQVKSRDGWKNLCPRQLGKRLHITDKSFVPEPEVPPRCKP